VRFRAHQIDGAFEPIPFLVGLLWPPKSTTFQFTFNDGDQFCDRKLLQMLLIEP